MKSCYAFSSSGHLTEGKVVSTEIEKIKLPYLMTNPTVNSAYKPDESKLELKKKIQRVGNLITEYDEGKDRYRNSNPELHDFVLKLKVVLNAEADMTKSDEISFSNSELSENDSVAGSSSSFSQIDGGNSNNNPNPKVIEALGIHVVLTEIFKYGGFRDLKNFRLINKQWKGVANSAIIQRRLWKLRIHETFGAISGNRSKALLELNDCIEASGGSFPLTGLDFSDVDYYNNLDSDALLQFYFLIGQSIKHLRFSNFGPLTVSEFQDLLVSNMPNVNDIEAGNIVFTSQQECCVPIVLPGLETIVFIDSNKKDLVRQKPFEVLPYYRDLLRSAKNLKKIIYFPVQLLDTVIEIGKMDCIQSFNYPLKLGKSEMCVKFSYTESKLTLLNVTRNSFDPYDDDDEVILLLELVQSLKRILISSKGTLNHLICMPRVFPADFQLPKFANLQFLTVYDSSDDWDEQLPPPRVFPAETECSEIFPNLHTVTLDTPYRNREVWHEYFPDQEFPSVKTVVFKHNFQFEGSLKAHFPNASHIKILNFERMISRTEEDELCKRVFHLELDSKIESLELHRCILDLSGPEYHQDPLFTGVPTYICKKLLEKHNTNQARGEDENIIGVKEILKLVQTQHYMLRNSEGLRRLKLFFNHPHNASFRVPKNFNSDSDSEDSGDSLLGTELEPSTPVISPVSCVYGFSLMPNLEEVIIGYDHYLPNSSDIAQVFKPFAEFPYIKIFHEPSIEV